MYPFYPCVYKPIPWRSVLARETDVRDALRMGGSEGGLKRTSGRRGERERGCMYTYMVSQNSLPLKC